MARIHVYPMSDEPEAEKGRRQQKRKTFQPPEGVTRGSAPFRPQARLIRMLGEELISDESMALLELVKNSYDADARSVYIHLQSSNGVVIDAIEIRDDGDGMTLDTILTGWMEPATRSKRGGRWKQRTPLGRFPLGEKGVGRFATDKLGAELELVSRARGTTDEVSLRVGWSLFDADAYLDEVESHWEVRSPDVFPGDLYGTSIQIGKLRARWDSVLIERVRNSLSRLVSPGTDTADFLITLECPLYPEFSGPIRNRALERAPYRLAGQVDLDGCLRLEDSTGTVTAIDIRAKALDHFRDEDGALRAPFCGPFQLALHAWDLDMVGLRSAGIDRSMRQILKQWSGVSIYRDGFRVLPYGETDDDWLELNQRRVNNPTLRLSNNQVIGIVEITQQHNPELRDRTSREGMIDTPALADLKHLVLGALTYLEEDRFHTRRQLQQVERVPCDEQDPVVALMRQLADQEQGTSLKAVVAEMERLYRARIDAYEQREENLLRLAGLGVAADRMARSMASSLTQARQLTDILNHHTARIPGALEKQDLISRPLQQLEGTLETLQDHLRILSPLSSDVVESSDHVDLRTVVIDAINVFSRHFIEAGILVKVTHDALPVVKAHYGHLLQCVLALFDNALYWLRNLPHDASRELRVHLWSNRRRGGLTVADNGPGISPTITKLVFEPSYSTRRDGVGLGLFIVRTLVERYAGSIEILEKDCLLPGANLQLQFRLPVA